VLALSVSCVLSISTCTLLNPPWTLTPPSTLLVGKLHNMMANQLCIFSACTHSEDELSLAAAPDYHLTRALTSPLQRLPPGGCPLPSPGDLTLALAVLGTASGGVAEVQALVKGVLGDQGSAGPGGLGATSSVASYATVQRAVMAGVHAHALRALKALQPGRDPASLLCDVLECDPLQLLAKASAEYPIPKCPKCVNWQ
jgi:hypothetical protein